MVKKIYHYRGVFMNNQVAFITGAGSGVGRGIAQRLGRDGLSLALIDINESGVHETSRLISSDEQTLCLTGDVTSENDIKRMVETTIERFGRIDVLITAAGIIDVVPVVDMELSTWNRILNVNLTGTFLTCREVAPHMIRQQNGRIITIGSINGKDGSPLSSAYCASKHGVLGFTSSLGVELAPYGITVNSVCPGPVETELQKRSWEARAKRQGKTAEAFTEEKLRTIPLGRLTTPEDIAGLVAFLISPDASYITRTHIDVAGGLRILEND